MWLRSTRWESLLIFFLKLPTALLPEPLWPNAEPSLSRECLRLTLKHAGIHTRGFWKCSQNSHSKVRVQFLPTHLVSFWSPTGEGQGSFSMWEPLWPAFSKWPPGQDLFPPRLQCLCEEWSTSHSLLPTLPLRQISPAVCKNWHRYLGTPQVGGWARGLYFWEGLPQRGGGTCVTKHSFQICGLWRQMGCHSWM